ncbi:hypothetical protein NC652_012071 [Populus alba x Populus x berolinensis]|nr:hypothetical protein NC652_012071 [Populus alba x Populus x berolinensis]
MSSLQDSTTIFMTTKQNLCREYCFSSCLGRNLIIDPILEEESFQDGSLMITCMPSHYEVTQLTITGEWSTANLNELPVYFSSQLLTLQSRLQSDVGFLPQLYSQWSKMGFGNSGSVRVSSEDYEKVKKKDIGSSRTISTEMDSDLFGRQRISQVNSGPFCFFICVTDVNLDCNPPS